MNHHQPQEKDNHKAHNLIIKNNQTKTKTLIINLECNSIKLASFFIIYKQKTKIYSYYTN